MIGEILVYVVGNRLCEQEKYDIVAARASVVQQRRWSF